MDYLQYLRKAAQMIGMDYGFKPCYKWITFNTLKNSSKGELGLHLVLNLVINGLPSIQT